MKGSDLQKLVDDTERQILEIGGRVGVLNNSGISVELLRQLATRGLLSAVVGVYATVNNADGMDLHEVPIRPLSALGDDCPEILVIGADEDKEDLIQEALPYLQNNPKLIVAGYGHYGFRDALFNEVSSQLLVPSLANGYKNSLVHLYQCLTNAARLGLKGIVAEFGMFKGGTTKFMATVIKRLGVGWPILGFDTFAGFPQRRSPLDMYDDPGCVFTNLAAVEAYLANENVRIVVGDIVDTCVELTDKDLVLTFMDTDNYSPARAALEVVRERTVVNGAIVFDHFTGDERFRYTLGERFAAKALVDDNRYFNLHGTGVFIRQRE